MEQRTFDIQSSNRETLDFQVRQLELVRSRAMNSPITLEDGAAKAYAFARGRDLSATLTRSDSEVGKLLLSRASRQQEEVTKLGWTPEDELEFRSLVLLTKDRVQNGHENPVTSNHNLVTLDSKVNDALPGIIIKSRAFQVLLSLFGLAVVFAFVGTVRFLGLEYDVKKSIDEKERELAAQVSKQQTSLESIASSLKRMEDGIASSRAELQFKVEEAKSRVAQIESAADTAILQFKRDVERKYGPRADSAASEAEAAMKARRNEILDSLDRRRVEGISEIADAAKKRAEAVLKEDKQEFLVKRLDQLEQTTTRLKAELTLATTRQSELSSRERWLSSAVAAATSQAPSTLNRLGAYFGEALWVVYSGAAAVLILGFGSIILSFYVLRRQKAEA